MAISEPEISQQPNEPNQNPSKTRFRRKQKHNAIHQNPTVSFPSSSSSSSSAPLQTTTTCKSSISSLFLSTFSPSSSSSKKKIFASATFRGLGCVSHAEVSAPAATAAVRSSADWQAKRVRKKKQRRKKQAAVSAMATQGPAVVVPDVWCSPGIGLVADAAPVDCVVARRVGARGRADGERSQGERSCIIRRSSNLEQLSSMQSPSAFETRHLGPDFLPAGHYHHLRGFHHSPGGLAEIMMLQRSFLLGGTDGSDRYRDWRLDVDNMSYEELLELGDRIGYVNTGLREDEIFGCLRRMKHSILDALPPHLSTTGMEWKCSICQEEYEADDEVGKLECGHCYHIYCIKQWLLQKNACPVCKTAAADAAR